MTKSPRKKPPKKPPKKSPFPSHEDILKFIGESPGRVGKREIARAFKLDAKQKMTLKKVLREMQQTGTLEKGRKKRVRKPGTLPPVTVLEIIGPNIDGDLMARPVDWEGRGDGAGEAPKIYMLPDARRGAHPGPGGRVLARLSKTSDGDYEARVIRAIAAAPEQILGVFEVVGGPGGGHGRLIPTDRRSKGEYAIDKRDTLDARPGDLVRAEPLPGRKLGLRQAKIVERVPGGEGSAKGGGGAEPRRQAVIGDGDHRGRPPGCGLTPRHAFDDFRLAQAELAAGQGLGANKVAGLGVQGITRVDDIFASGAPVGGNETSFPADNIEDAENLIRRIGDGADGFGFIVAVGRFG